jgi:hypothetical protein
MSADGKDEVMRPSRSKARQEKAVVVESCCDLTGSESTLSNSPR